MLTIGELAARSGVATSALRFYEERGLIASERDMLAKRIADAPAAWISIPMWGRVFVMGRRLLGIDRRAGKGR